MLCVGIFLIVIYIIIVGIRKIKGNYGLIEGSDDRRAGGTILKGLVVATSLFFIPFGLMTGMGLTRGITSLIFPPKQIDNSSNNNLFNTKFSSTLTQSASDLYKYTQDTQMVTDLTTINADVAKATNYLISHTQTGYADSEWNNYHSQAQANAGLYKIEDLSNLLSRMKYEIIAFNKNAINRAPSEITDISQGISQLIEDWESKWGVAGSQNIQQLIKDLATLASQAKVGNKDEESANKIQKDWQVLKNFTEETSSVTEALVAFSSKREAIKMVFNKTTTQIDSTIASLEPLKTITDDKVLVDTEATISFINFENLAYSLLNVGDGNKNEALKAWKPITELQPTTLSTSQVKSLEAIASDLYVLVNGLDVGHDQLVSLFDLQMAFSNKTQLPLVTLIYRVASGNNDNNLANSPKFSFNEALPRSAIGIFMIMTVIGILAQLIKRIIVRFAKLAWLWIMGSAILPTSLNDGGAKVRVWVTMAFVELLSLFALMGMWYIWKSLSEPLINEVDKVPNISSMSKGVVSFFAIAGLLEIVIASTDWFAELVGANDGYSSMRQLTGGAKALQHLIGAPSKMFGKVTGGIKGGNNLIRGRNIVSRNATGGVTGSYRSGGLLGKGGLAEFGRNLFRGGK